MTETLFFRSATQSHFKQIKAELIIVVDLTKEKDRPKDGEIVSFGKKGDGNLVFSPLSDEEYASWPLRQYFQMSLHYIGMNACVVKAARLERNQQLSSDKHFNSTPEDSGFKLIEGIPITAAHDITPMIEGNRIFYERYFAYYRIKNMIRAANFRRLGRYLANNPVLSHTDRQPQNQDQPGQGQLQHQEIPQGPIQPRRQENLRQEKPRPRWRVPGRASA